MDTDHGIDCGIEVRRAAELLGSNLILLDRGAGVFDGVVGEIPQELAERFRAVEDGAGGNPLYLT